MARKSQSTFEDIADIAAKLPWWLSVFLAAVSFFLLHKCADKEVPIATTGMSEIFQNVLPGFLRSFAFFGQIIIPSALLLGSLISIIRNLRRRKLYDTTCRSTSSNPLEDISWREFEQLTGEYFRRQGYKIQETKVGPDGGIDLILKKKRKKTLVQCKHWKASKIGVKVVRELLGVITAAKASGGFVVTSGEFSQDAVAFADANNIRLLDGNRLIRGLKLQAKQERQPEKHIVGTFQKAKWLLVGLIVVIVFFSASLFFNMGTSFYSTFSNHFKEFSPKLQDNQKVKSTNSSSSTMKTESTDLTFTDEQVQKAMEEVLNQKKNEQLKILQTGQEGEKNSYLFEIELFSGGWVYTDNVEVTDEKITYISPKGIVVSVNRDEVKTIKKK